MAYVPDLAIYDIIFFIKLSARLLAEPEAFLFRTGMHNYSRYVTSLHEITSPTILQYRNNDLCTK